MFEGCAATLKQANLCFAQLETTISERGAAVPNAKLAMRAPPAMAQAPKTPGSMWFHSLAIIASTTATMRLPIHCSTRPMRDLPSAAPVRILRLRAGLH